MAETAIQEGKTAPAFKLQDAAGNPVALADFEGRDVILYFYPKDDTPGCTKQACGFRDLWSDIQALGAVVIGVSPDGPDAHTKFTEKYSLPFTLLCDPDRACMTRYGAYGEKMMYGKKTTGVIRSTVWIGADGVIQKHWKRVASAEKHPAQVLAILKAGA